MARQTDLTFDEGVAGLRRGDFSRLEPLFAEHSTTGRPCSIIDWYEQGLFAREPAALNEALTCACFNGRTQVAAYLLDRGVDPEAGSATGLNAFHWAANRGQLATVKLLIERNAPLETKNMYGGTVLGCAVYSAVHEPRPDHRAIIEALLQAGASLDTVDYPSGSSSIDELLIRHGLKP